MASFKMLILAISIVTIFPLLASSRNLGPHNRPYKRAHHHEMPQYHRPHHAEPQYRQRLHVDGHHEHYDEPSQLTIKGHVGGTVGFQKKHKYKANFHKTNELLFGKGGITKNKINNAVRQFGEAYVDPTLGEDNKNALFNDVGKVVKNTHGVKNHLDNNVLAIGDVFIGKKNKKRIRQNANNFLSKDAPRYVKGTLYHQNLIHSKARQKTQKTLDQIQKQAYLEAYPHIQKLKKGSSGDGLLSSFDKSAKKLTKSFVKKYMPFIYNKTPYEQRISNPVNIVPLMYTAATLTLELISLAASGTPALYGINPEGVIGLNPQGILG